MSYRQLPRKAFHIRLGEDLGNEALILPHRKGMPVEGGDARRLLPPVLEGEKSVIDQPRGVPARRVDRHDPALFLGFRERGGLERIHLPASFG